MHVSHLCNWSVGDTVVVHVSVTNVIGLLVVVVVHVSLTSVTGVLVANW